MDPGVLETRLLRTRLVRNRNWVGDCLKEAVEVGESALEAMK